jgi:hypothetical protein
LRGLIELIGLIKVIGLIELIKVSGRKRDRNYCSFTLNCPFEITAESVLGSVLFTYSFP